MIMEEIWKDIEGYESYYQVSNLGKARSLDRTYIDTMGRAMYKEGKILKNGLDKDGYLLVVLCKNGKQSTKKVHRLVAISFLENKNNYPIVCHKDDNPQNNNVNNLFWGTTSMNMQDMISKGRQNYPKGEKCFLYNKNFGSKIVLDFETGIYYESLKDAAIAKCIKYSTLAGKLNNSKTKNNTSLKYV